MSKIDPPELIPFLQDFRADHPEPSKCAFIMMRFDDTDLHRKILLTIRKWCEKEGIVALRADDKRYADELWPNVRTYMHGCGFGIAVFERLTTEEFNPNVSLEVGYMHALGKPVCLLKDSTLATLQTDLVGRLYDTFDTQRPRTLSPVLDRWKKDKASTLSKVGIASSLVLSRYLAIKGLRWSDVSGPDAGSLYRVAGPLNFNLVDGTDIVFLGLFQAEPMREVAFRLFYLLKNLAEARHMYETMTAKTLTPTALENGRRIWASSRVEVVVSPDIDSAELKKKIKQLTKNMAVLPWSVITEADMRAAVDRQYDVLNGLGMPAGVLSERTHRSKYGAR